MPEDLFSSKPMQYAAAVVVVLAAIAVLGVWMFVILTGKGDTTQPGDILSGLIYGGGVVGGGVGVHWIHTSHQAKLAKAALPSEQVHAPVAQGATA